MAPFWGAVRRLDLLCSLPASLFSDSSPPPVPAHEMGASWLRAHPVFRTEREDKALARALAIDDRLATAAADASSSSSSSTSSASSASFSTTNGAGGAAAAAARPRGAPANGSFPVPGLLGGRLHLVDVGATRFGSCDTFECVRDAEL